jgi:hypothetical protein
VDPFPRQQVGTCVTLPDGRTYRIHREVPVDADNTEPLQPGAVFIPHFRVRNMSPRVNIWFSRLPMLIILGLPGFRSELWLIHEPSGEFAGRHEWEAGCGGKRDAEKCQHSPAMTFMTRRSNPESVSSEVLAQSPGAAREVLAGHPT